MWTSLYPYRLSEARRTEADKSRTDSFRIGSQSYCIRIITNADGTPGSHVECTLYLDLGAKIEKNIRLD
jgi:hypothetical protein